MTTTTDRDLAALLASLAGRTNLTPAELVALAEARNRLDPPCIRLERNGWVAEIRQVQRGWGVSVHRWYGGEYSGQHLDYHPSEEAARVAAEAWLDGMAIGTRIRRLREARGWTRYRLGKEAGVSAVGLDRIETGRQAPTWETMCRLADALGVGLDEIRGGQS